MSIDEGIRLSDARTRLLMKRLEEVYADAFEIAVANNEKAIAKFASFKDSDFPGLTPAKIKLKREAYIREVNRTKAVYKNIAAEIANAGDTAAKIIQGEMTGIYGLNYSFAAFDIQEQAGLNLSFTQYDRNQLAVLVQEGQSPFTKIAYKNLGKNEDVVRRLQNHFIQGVMNGESQPKLIRRIKGVTGQSTWQAKRVAQTERTRVQSQGRMMGIHEAAAMGLGMRSQWIARLVNTRDAHAALHLRTVAEGEKFESPLGEIAFPGDPAASAANVINCHCLIKPMVESTSRALAKHREEFRVRSFHQFLELTDKDFILAQNDIDYFKGRVSTRKQLLAKAEKRGDKKAVDHHAKLLKKSESKLSSAYAHRKNAKNNHERAVRRAIEEGIAF